MKYFQELELQIKELEENNSNLSRDNEVAWEQVAFARDLVQEIDNFAEDNLTKNKLEQYNILRTDTYFEV